VPALAREPWLDRGERTHEAACLQELAAPVAARRQMAVEGLLIDLVHRSLKCHSDKPSQRLLRRICCSCSLLRGADWCRRSAACTLSSEAGSRCHDRCRPAARSSSSICRNDLRFTRNERACLLFRVEDYRQIFNMLKRELVYVRNRMGGPSPSVQRHPNGRCRAWVRQFV
jgi:hypothetical protein